MNYNEPKADGGDPGAPARGWCVLRWGWWALPGMILVGLVVPGMVVTALGCQEERIINYRPMLGGVPGAESGTPVTGLHTETNDPTVVPEDKLVVEHPDGSKTLTARTARHLMVHIHNTLQDGDEDLFVEQVLSRRTTDEYYDRGMDPREAFRTIKARRSDVDRLFDAMPMGEYTPGLFLRPVGGGVQRLEVQGPAARELAWTGFDLVMEKGNFRLRWFVTPE